MYKIALHDPTKVFGLQRAAEKRVSHEVGT